ncbi:MAG: elongation factor P [Phycisphaerales bacterium]|jgi:elongation factor P|nr:elongation factor P [Phycisphaerales bacterium]MBT7170641.1 elongation factor P [Phycisphaerales bacterium]
MAQKVSDFKRGMGAWWKDDMYIFGEMHHVKPGKGPAYLQCKMKKVSDGSVVSTRFRNDDTLEPIHFDRKPMEYLYSDGKSHVMMDTETYDQTEVPHSALGDRAAYLTENCSLMVCFVEEKVISVELPNTVELVVEDVPPNVKGATATNQLKDAVCEGGAKVKVPPFVENGQRIEVDTRTGDYVGRV